MVGRIGHRTLWTFLITSIALVMVTLDNLVVSTALPVIRTDLGASIEGLEWTVNAYTLTFAVFLLTGAALGDRFGRRRMFVIGLGIFTLASALAALAPTIEALVAARALQGLGGAIIAPLTLTILSAAVPAERRGLALGAWGGIGGLAVALGPLVGGAVIEGLSWQSIFWINVPIGLVLMPLAWRRLDETQGPGTSLDLRGLALVSAGLFGIVWGLVRGNGQGWWSPEIVGSLIFGPLLVAAFVLWELRAREPMLPMRFFSNRTFSHANVASFFMFFGMFGSIFLLAQFFQTVQGYSPLQAGLRILRGRRCRSSWRRSPAHFRSIGGHRIMGVGLSLQAIGLAGSRPSRRRRAVRTARRSVHPVRHRHGALLRPGSQRRAEHGAAAGRRTGVGANNAIRELGGVSASRCWPRSSPGLVATSPRRHSWTARASRLGRRGAGRCRCGGGADDSRAAPERARRPAPALEEGA